MADVSEDDKLKKRLKDLFHGTILARKTEEVLRFSPARLRALEFALTEKVEGYPKAQLRDLNKFLVDPHFILPVGSAENVMEAVEPLMPLEPMINVDPYSQDHYSQSIREYPFARRPQLGEQDGVQLTQSSYMTAEPGMEWMHGASSLTQSRLLDSLTEFAPAGQNLLKNDTSRFKSPSALDASGQWQTVSDAQPADDDSVEWLFERKGPPIPKKPKEEMPNLDVMAKQSLTTKRRPTERKLKETAKWGPGKSKVVKDFIFKKATIIQRGCWACARKIPFRGIGIIAVILFAVRAGDDSFAAVE